jgi:hypothetical protein
MRNFVIGGLAALLLAFAALSSAQAQVNPAQMFGCRNSAIYDASTSGSTKLVTGNATSRIYVCGYVFFAGGTANVKLVYGTGTNCATGATSITPAYQLTSQTGAVDRSPYYAGLLPAPASNDLCINTSAGVAVAAVVYYTQF